MWYAMRGIWPLLSAILSGPFYPEKRALSCARMESTDLLLNATHCIKHDLALMYSRYSSKLSGGSLLDSKAMLIRAPFSHK